MNTAIEDLITIESNKLWLYFGCIGPDPGHRLYDQTLRTPNLSFAQRKLFENLDGQLCYKDRSPYKPKLTRMPKTGYSAFAFWDYMGDSRGGSNSIFFVPNLSLDINTMWLDIQRIFPSLTERWKDKICLS